MATPNDFIPESGNRYGRIEYVRETARGVTPDNPSWKSYSSNVRSWWDWEPDAQREEVVPHGEVNPNFTEPASEIHDVTVSYYLQEWFVDGSGNAQDASADAMLISSDNSFNNTHSVQGRMEVNSNGNDSAGYRVYHVGKGGAPTGLVVPFEVDNGEAVTPELSYQFEKFRTYIIHQPSSSTTLDITNNGSTSVDVTVENESAGTAETNTVSGGSTVTTTNSFGDIDVVELSTDTDGTVTVTDGSGTTFTTIVGSDEYTGEGDLGIPALGSGSHNSNSGSIGESNNILFNDDTPPQWGGSELEAEWISGELEIDLDVGDNAVGGTSRRNIYLNSQSVIWNNTVAGDAPSVAQVDRYLTGESNDIVWTADEGSVTGPDAEYFSPGGSSFEPGNGKNERDIELRSDGLTLS